MRKPETLRLHGLDVFYDISQYAAFLLVPLLRGIFSFGGSLQTWLAGLWLDALAVFFMLALSFWRWRRSWLFLSPFRLVYARGVFFRRESVFLSRHLATLRIFWPAFLRPLSAAVVTPFPVGPVGREKRPMLVSAKTAEKIRKSLLPKKGKPLGSYRSVGREVAFFTALNTNAGAGLAFFITLLSGTGKLLGRDLSAELYGFLAGFAKFFSEQLPPSAVLAGGIFCIGYAMAFLRGVWEYRRFSAVRYAELFQITGGLFPRYCYEVFKREVSSVSVQFRLVSKIWGRYSLFMRAPGYGGKTFRPVLVPSAGAKIVLQTLRKLVPECPPLYAPVRVPKSNWWPFVRWPAIGMLLLGAGALAVGHIWQDFAALALFWGGMGMVWALWMLLHGICALFHTGLGVSENGVIALYVKQRTFHRIFLPYDMIVRVSILQSIGQAKLGLCTVQLWEKGILPRKHTIRGISAAKVEALGLSAKMENFLQREKE